MTYPEALQFLDSRISLGWKLGLESMRAMLEEFGNPQEKLRFVHIAGTNGKGSVAALLAGIFSAAGFRTGLYTSPHLSDVRERIRLSGRMIDKGRFASLLERMRPTVERFGATYFETLTAAALLYFAAEEAEIVCLEVGLGGRLDATNIIRPLVSVITSISFDHMEHLGSTLAQIAAEKAGIVKAGVPCVIGALPSEAEETVRRICEERGAEFVAADRAVGSQILSLTPERMTVKLEGQTFSEIVKSRLIGRRQEGNLRTVTAVCEVLCRHSFFADRLTDSAFRRGIAACRWPGRFEILRRKPLVIADVAHNLDSIRALQELLQELYTGRRIVVIMGLLADKDAVSISRCITDIAEMVYTVTPNSHRALSAERLAACFVGTLCRIAAVSDLKTALDQAITGADKESIICITGSHYVVGEARLRIKNLTT